MSAPKAPLLVRALRGEPVERIPAWVMRQAGRYLPEYRALKERHGFLRMMSEPDLAVETTLQPIRRFPLDGAILFSDIMTPLLGMGVGLRFDPGPVLDRPLATRADVESLRPLDPHRDTGFVAETLRRVKPQLPEGVALLGFAGSPFTVASYLVSGGGGKGEAQAIRRMMYADPDTLHLLLGAVAEATVAYLRMQIEAGADAVQIFDTWGPLLSRREYQAVDQPHIERIVDGISDLGAPVILYCGGAPHQLEDAAATGVDALSVDHRVPMNEARAATGGEVALQGNLDPAVLFGPRERVEEETERVLLQAGARGTVFNLGHGIWPTTPVEAVEGMLATVRSTGERICARAAAGGAR
ncbi:MAG: uroporphyrinogen decarboxylase [Planctomycetes bacterium]|nr:uroporphyrinogen decarboxylase [Planctomycetota bacterium]